MPNNIIILNKISENMQFYILNGIKSAVMTCISVKVKLGYIIVRSKA